MDAFKGPMSVQIKTPEAIERMRVAGRLAAEVLDMIGPYVQPDVTTQELDERCHEHIVKVQGGIPAPLNYRGFPKSICTSVNHVVCHGIPANKRLKKGDIVNLDITVIKDGYHGDTSMMFCVGEPSILAKRLVKVTREALWRGIAVVRPGATLGDIGHAIQQFVEAHGYSVVREYCGHGIGREFHEDPQVLHYGKPGEGLVLRAGMCFTIEPMVNAGKRFIKLLPDAWTVVTKDHSLSAQWEHTLLVTPDGHEVLTLRADERAEVPGS
jgi:methionyl aminopeptidase